eukprot:scaffold36576_cov372-Skeletonema_dohrnii-CCMP3373.AAC.3
MRGFQNATCCLDTATARQDAVEWVESLLSMYCNPSRVETIGKGRYYASIPQTIDGAQQEDSKTPLVVLIGRYRERSYDE